MNYKLTSEEAQFVQKTIENHSDGLVISWNDIVSAANSSGFNVTDAFWEHLKKFYKSLTGGYDLYAMLKEPVFKRPGRPKGSKNKQTKDTVPISKSIIPLENGEDNEAIFVPKKDELFVSFGHYCDIKNIVKSKIFYPIYVTGLSGNGKTTMVEQICADLKRQMVRVNITHETDEDNLLGGFRLVNGNTVWFDGPVVKALKTGAVLLLDEVDLNAVKILCLQPVLEGKGIFLKRINQYIYPKEGFNIIATANTKGKGSEDGKFIGTNVMNEAFLERFAVTFEQEYPQKTVEQKILKILFKHHAIVDDEFCEVLVNWADSTRLTYKEGGIDEIISTRRLVHIARAFAIFNNKEKAIELCINRFDTNTKTALLDMYSKCLPLKDIDVKFSEEKIQEEPKIKKVISNWASLPELEPIN
jgi:hypothetical protein